MPRCQATSPMAKMSGSVVCKRSSTTTPPRGPTSRPQSRASSSRGRMPAEMTTMSTSSRVAVGERQALDLAVAEKLLRALAQVDPDAQPLDLLAQRPRARLVDLARHQPRGELDDVGLEAEVADRLGGLQAEQAAADHRRPRRRAGVGEDPLQVLDRAVDEHPLLVDAGDRRHERGRAGRQDDGVVLDLPALLRDDHPALAVDRGGPVADVQRDAVFGVPRLAGQLQVLRRRGARSTSSG